MLQYNNCITEFSDRFDDRPMLFILQPNVSQNFFHPRFLKPMSRHEFTEKLSGLLIKLGWATDPETGDISEEDEVQTTLLGKGHGVTMVSHSK
jgi:hypothetical protein